MEMNAFMSRSLLVDIKKDKSAHGAFVAPYFLVFSNPVVRAVT